jgi:glycosyltransferase involved in cell wall biosynthesis
LFLGPAFGDAKDALLRRADAFILPSFSEGLPMSVLEAWSYGLPVLMTEGFAAEAAIRIGTGVRGQGSGVRGQPMGIDEGMRTMMEMSDSERVAMGQHGRALAEQNFTWPQVAALVSADVVLAGRLRAAIEQAAACPSAPLHRSTPWTMMSSCGSSIHSPGA